MSSARSSVKALLVVALFAGPAAADVESPRQLVATIAQHAALAHAELRFARAEGQRERVRCLDGKLSEIHAQERLATEREQLLAAAIARGDEARAVQSRRMLIALRDRARQLSREAQRCGRFGDLPPSGYRVRLIAAR